MLDSALQEGRLDSSPAQARFEHTYKTYFRPVEGQEKQTEVIVCHANVIKYLLCKTIGIEDKCSNFIIPNCSMTGIQILPKSSPKIHFVAFESTCHFMVGLPGYAVVILYV